MFSKSIAKLHFIIKGTKYQLSIRGQPSTSLLVQYPLTISFSSSLGTCLKVDVLSLTISSLLTYLHHKANKNSPSTSSPSTTFSTTPHSVNPLHINGLTIQATYIHPLFHQEHFAGYIFLYNFAVRIFTTKNNN